MSVKNIIPRIKIFLCNKIRFWGKKVRFPKSALIDRNAVCEGENDFGVSSVFYGRIGYGSYLGKNSHVYGYIGRFVLIANNVHVIIGRHPFKPPFVSTHASFGSPTACFVEQNVEFEEYKYADSDHKYHICIQDDSWIGEDARFEPSVCVIHYEGGSTNVRSKERDKIEMESRLLYYKEYKQECNILLSLYKLICG